MPDTLTLECRDGTPLSALLYPTKAAKGCVVIGSALGVPQGFYKSFAEYLAEHSFHCLTFDYRGTGESVHAPLSSIQLKDWGEQDIDAAINAIRNLEGADSLPVHYIGHSIGGQLLGLAPAAQQLTSILHVAASQPHWTRLEFPHNLKLISVGHLVLPLVALGKEEFPSSKVGLAALNLPSGVATTWARWMRHKDYLFAKKFGLNTEGYKALKQPLISWSISDDHMAPYKPVDELVKRFPNSQSEHRNIDARTLGTGTIGHTGFFKKSRKESLWHEVLSVLNKHSA